MNKLLNIKNNKDRYYYKKYKDYDMEFFVYEIKDELTGDIWSSPSFKEIKEWCKCSNKEERTRFERMYG